LPTIPDYAPAAVVTLGQPGDLQHRQWRQDPGGLNRSRDGDLVDAGGSASGQGLVHSPLFVAEPVERGRRPGLLWR
jgi:hypothetical protein